MTTYKGYKITKTGRSFCDYHCMIDNRPRWGTLGEIKADINSYIMGRLIPYEPNK